MQLASILRPSLGFSISTADPGGGLTSLLPLVNSLHVLILLPLQKVSLILVVNGPFLQEFILSLSRIISLLPLKPQS